MHELTWGLPVIAYLYLAGLGAGALTTSAALLLKGPSDNGYFNASRYGALLASIPVAIGAFFLVFELGSFQSGHYFRFLNLYTVINLSPMSIGTWLITFFLLISIVYAYTFVHKTAGQDNDKFVSLRKTLAWISIPLGIGVAVYTGVLLGSMPARPFWNSPLLALIFLLSALSSGIAAILLTRTLLYGKLDGVLKDNATETQYNDSNYLLTTSDTVIIAMEVVAILLFIMYAQFDVGSAKAAVSVILAGGSLATSFWFGLVLFGLLLPFVLELYLIIPRLLKRQAFYMPKSLEIIIPIAVLVGGFVLRYIIVVAGQITFPLGV